MSKQYRYLNKRLSMKNNFTKLLVLIISILICTSCIDLQENLYLQKDGSGRFSFVVNMGEFKSMMDMFDFGNNKNGKFESEKTPTEQINSAFEITSKKLLEIKGISNVRSIEDTINYSFGIGFDFNDINALNKAMYNLFDNDTVKSNKKKTTYFTWKNNKLTRLETLDTKSFLGKTAALSGKNKNNDAMNSLFNFEKLFENISYSTNYIFENKIISSNNPNASLSSDSKNITIKCYPFATEVDSTQKKCDIGNTITFK